MFPGDEQPLYAKFAPQIKQGSTLEEQSVQLQQMCMKYAPSVGHKFNIYNARVFLSKYRRKNGPITHAKSKGAKSKRKISSQNKTGTQKKKRKCSPPKKRDALQRQFDKAVAEAVAKGEHPEEYSPPKKRDALERQFDKAVAEAVAKGEHPEDASARLINKLIDGRKHIACAVAATPIDGTTVVEDMIESQVETGREQFESGLEYIVDRGTFSSKTYSDSVQPTLNKMMEVAILR